jgi:cytochrome c-type biogenesis protein CcmH
MNQQTIATMSDSIEGLRQQLQQLQEQYSAGALPKESYDAEKVALERRLLDQVMATPPQQGDARWMFAGIATVALVVVAAGYWWTGSRATTGTTTVLPGMSAMPATPGMSAKSTQPVSIAPAIASSAPHGTETGQVASMVDRLAQRLKDQPQDAEGWAMLARSYSVLGRHPEALKAYEKAIALRKGDANLLADYADSLAVQNNRVLAGEPLKLVVRALQLEPRNLKALSMAGSEAFDRQDYKQAIQYWQQVVEFGPADSPMVQQVKPSLEHAQQLAGAPRTGKP